MANNTDIKVITGIKLKYLSEKINEYGTNHMFQLLDESTFKEWVELKDLKTIWEYNGKCYLKVNDVKLKEVQVENGFKENVPCIMELSFIKYDFHKRKKENVEHITGYSISKINKILSIYYKYRYTYIYIYIYMFTEWDYQNQL